MSFILLDLPIPPSLNSNWRSGKSRTGKIGVYSSPKYAAWKTVAGWEARQQKAKPVQGPFSFRVHFPATMRGDIDNRIKPLLDLLQSLGLIENDDLCQRITASKEPDISAKRCALLVVSKATEAA